MTRIGGVLLALLCLLALIFSIWTMAGLIPSKESSSGYVLRDYGGRLALFLQDDAEPLEVYEVYTRLLPENDVLLLQKGLPVESREQLETYLEDFGL